MSAERIEQAMARISAAMERIEAVRLASETASETASESADKPLENDKAGSAKVLALVNAHEKLREEVADTIGQIDALIGELEGE